MKNRCVEQLRASTNKQRLESTHAANGSPCPRSAFLYSTCVLTSTTAITLTRVSYAHVLSHGTAGCESPKTSLWQPQDSLLQCPHPYPRSPTHPDSQHDRMRVSCPRSTLSLATDPAPLHLPLPSFRYWRIDRNSLHTSAADGILVLDGPMFAAVLE